MKTYFDAVVENPKAYEVAPGFIAVEFWKPEFCEFLIQASKDKQFISNYGDPVPGAELRITELNPNLFESYMNHYKRWIFPILSDYYCLPIEQWFVGWKTPFIIKYEMDGQRYLRPHFDGSLVTSTIKLNDEYTGGELIFPKSKYNAKNMEIGSMLIWASSIDTVHYSSELLSGKKYSFVGWTMNNFQDKGTVWKK